jgi:hypothetical protein
MLLLLSPTSKYNETPNPVTKVWPLCTPYTPSGSVRRCAITEAPAIAHTWVSGGSESKALCLATSQAAA